MRNIELVNYSNRLERYAEMKLPQKLVYAIIRNIRIISKEYETYDKMLKSLFRKYEDSMIHDDSGEITYAKSGIPVVEESVRAEFLDELNDLLNLEVDVKFYTINESIFDFDNQNRYDALSIDDTLFLMKLMCDGQ